MLKFLLPCEIVVSDCHPQNGVRTNMSGKRGNNCYIQYQEKFEILLRKTLKCVMAIGNCFQVFIV